MEGETPLVFFFLLLFPFFFLSFSPLSQRLEERKGKCCNAQRVSVSFPSHFLSGFFFCVFLCGGVFFSHTTSMFNCLCRSVCCFFVWLHKLKFTPSGKIQLRSDECYVKSTTSSPHESRNKCCPAQPLWNLPRRKCHPLCQRSERRTLPIHTPAARPSCRRR